MNNKQKRAGLIAAISAAAVAAFLLWRGGIPDKEECLRSTVWMEHRTTYAFPVPGADTLFCASLSLPLFDAAFPYRADSAYRSTCHTAFFISYDGCLIGGSEDEALPSPDSLESLVRQEELRLRNLAGIVAHQLKELAYYERTHSATDDGYTEVMTFYTELRHKKDDLDTLLTNVERLAGSQPTVEIRQSHYVYLPGSTGPQPAFPARPCNRLTASIEGLSLYQLSSQMLPDSCQRTPIPLWSLSPQSLKGLFHIPAFCLYAWDKRRCPAEQASWLTLPCEEGIFRHSLPASADGSPVLSDRGRFVGINRQGTCIPVATARKLLRTHRPFWMRWKAEGVALWKRIFQKTEDRT